MPPQELAMIMTQPELLQALYRDPQITAWNRLEGRPRSHDFTRSLRAEVRDAMWMLCRQWQMGEYAAEDAGSPIDARLLTRRLSVDRVKVGGGPVEAYDDMTPLEALVERERIPLTYALRVRVGEYFLTLHTPALRDAYVDRYRDAFPIAQDRDAEFAGQPDALNLYRATRRHAIDGGALLAALGDGSFETKVPLVPPDDAQIREWGAALVRWFARQYSQPPAGSPAAWDPSKLSYAVRAAAPAGEGAQAGLVAPRYSSGHLDWDAFDFDGTAPELTLEDPTHAEPAPVEEALSFLPVAATFKGTPNPRFWEIEEREVNFGALNAKTTDELLLVFAEMGLVYGNDWFVIPYTLRVNSLCEVEALVVTDVFGDRTLVPAADQGAEEDWRRWSLFDLSDAGELGSYRRQFYLPPALPEQVDSEALERVQFVRDEIANMVWGIEEVVPDETGRGINGHDAADRTGVTPPPISDSPAAIRYVLGTSVPENWIPFLPVHRPGSSQEIALQRAAMPRLGHPPRDVIRPKGAMLTEPGLPYFLNEEEVSVAGTAVTRAYQRTRWYDGRTYVWLGRRRETGRGAGTSTLRFDQIEPTS